MADSDLPRDLIGRATAVAWVALAAGFVLLCGGNLDPDTAEAPLGLAASEGLGPLGQVFGNWDPALWPAQVMTSQAWAWGEGGRASAAAVRWPSAIAAVLLGLILCRRSAATFGPRAALTTGLCLFGCVGLIDRSATSGLDLVAGLAIVGALDRLLNRGSGLAAGAWGALAILAGGWPPVAMVLLPTIVIGRRGAGLSVGLVAPIVAVGAAWSAWVLSIMPAEAWATALTLPLSQKSALWLIPGALACGLPWSPFALLAASRSVREGWSPAGRALVVGWLQVAAVAALAGTLVPGMGVAAKVTAVAALAVVAGAGLDRAWAGLSTRSARRLVMAIALTTVVLWAAIALPLGAYLASAISFYRQIGLFLAVATFALLLAALRAVGSRSPRGLLAAMVGVACLIKVVHAGVYVPERNYRLSQGPWGRAIGQWVPPNWPIYTFHAWRADLAFATERPVRQLRDPKILQFKPANRPNFVLLLPQEFEHWPEGAPQNSEGADVRGRARRRARPGAD